MGNQISEGILHGGVENTLPDGDFGIDMADRSFKEKLM